MHLCFLMIALTYGAIRHRPAGSPRLSLPAETCMPRQLIGLVVSFASIFMSCSCYHTDMNNINLTLADNWFEKYRC